MSEDTLCCCEYQNMKGEKSHLLACCCDCEAFDEMADRCFKCEKIPSSLMDRFIDTCLDRLRIPGLTGGGASRVSIDVLAPMVIIPISLIIAATGPMTTIAVLLSLPYICFIFYRTWRRKTNKSRTKFFYVWGLASVFYMYLLFEMIICTYSSISVWDNLLITLSIMLMCIALNLAKMNPGVVQSGHGNKQFYKTFGFFGNLLSNIEDGEVEDGVEEEAGFEVIDKAELEEVVAMEIDKQRLGPPVLASFFAASEDSAVPTTGLRASLKDSVSHGGPAVGTDAGQKRSEASWCDVCNLEKPPRSGHCPVCAVCIKLRDHHCVWVDTCVGVDNHRSFLVAMAMFVLVGYYGSYLTMMSVCDPSDPHEVYCGFYTAYRDFKWGLCYAGAVYVVMVTSIMCVGLVHQVILISQNVTSQELHYAANQGRTQCMLIVRDHMYSRGLIQNWRDFIFKQRQQYQYLDV